ncbi:unnamed protein product, partial [Pleuronectes platessa]
MGMLLCLPAAQGGFTGFLQHSHAVTQFAGARSEEDARHLLAATSLLQSCTELSKQIPGLTADRPGRINPSKDTSRDGQVRSCHPLCALIDPGSGWCKRGRYECCPVQDGPGRLSDYAHCATVSLRSEEASHIIGASLCSSSTVRRRVDRTTFRPTVTRQNPSGRMRVKADQ